MPLISVICPVYNEEANIRRFHEAVTAVIDALSPEYRFELIFTDNDSTDATRARILELAARDPRIRYVKLSRNFGYQRSIWTGYSLARGDAAIELDADLEDDPAHIPAMLAEWKAGAAIVYGIRKQRAESKAVQGLRKLYYRFLASVSEDDLPVDAGDFMLLDRRILDILKRSRDPNIYIRGFVFSLGFPRTGFPYSRNERLYGTSKFNLRRMVSLGLDGLIRHSMLPLRVSSWVAAASSVVLLLMSVGYIVFKRIGGADWPPGFATLVVLQLVSFAMLALFIGILGEYVLRVYRIVNHEPMSVVEYEIAGEDAARTIPPDAAVEAARPPAAVGTRS